MFDELPLRVYSETLEILVINSVVARLRGNGATLKIEERFQARHKVCL